jgi:hypothetical protein
VTQIEIGQVVTTSGVAEWVEEKPVQRRIGAGRALQRHQSGDWGKVCPEDWELNNQSLKDGTRLLSSYEVDGRRLWVITEWDRSVTTILFPEEY